MTSVRLSRLQRRILAWLLAEAQPSGSGAGPGARQGQRQHQPAQLRGQGVGAPH
jgi:hypothetical protein